MQFITTLIEFWQDKEYRSLLYTTLFIVGGGAVFYRVVEGWSWVDAFYFCVVTLTTTGFGDLSPQTDLGKIFTIFYLIVGIGIILSFIDTVYHHYRDMKSNKSN